MVVFFGLPRYGLLLASFILLGLHRLLQRHIDFSLLVASVLPPQTQVFVVAVVAALGHRRGPGRIMAISVVLRVRVSLLVLLLPRRQRVGDGLHGGAWQRGRRRRRHGTHHRRREDVATPDPRIVEVVVVRVVLLLFVAADVPLVEGVAVAPPLALRSSGGEDGTDPGGRQDDEHGSQEDLPGPRVRELRDEPLAGRQVSAVEVLELAALPHVSVGALAVVQDRVGDLHREARRAVQAVPRCVGRRAGVRLEGDVGSDGTLGRRARLRRGPGRTSGSGLHGAAADQD